MNLFRTLLQYVDLNQEVFLITIVGGEAKHRIGQQILVDITGNRIDSTHDSEYLDLISDLSIVHRKSVGKYLARFSGKEIEIMVEPILPSPTLLVCGSGHIAQYLVSLGKMLSYQVIVVDDRPQYIHSPSFSQADQIRCGSFDEVLTTLTFHSECYAVLATRSHQTDAVCLASLMERSLSYIGMVCSKRKAQSIFSLVKDWGLDHRLYPHIYAPVGLDIHSETPQEIALSILAEIQLVRYGGTGRPISQMERQKVHTSDEGRIRPELDIFEKMAESWEEKKPFASVTIIDAVGHVPRGIGSRMIVWEDGTIYRTIGGGKRESEIIEYAVHCLKERKIERQEVTFTGSYNSSQPVCGGRFTYFIQPYFPNFTI
ncbi:XdhC/CoxI family protein [Thermoflavimicrobium daqui]|uniref:Xanthine dehydrogenase accessory factor n=1 Tax=Thermoflavimicrobium daqui TaxID=2137476 RepID=A0A364K9U6_9BACL|nr:XdhC/CoxI family protein [Thermoflavimicrobium daqui]RAL27063.1 hypothetical protein DL897_03250 [Thermoflavimicrobium daqui]